MKAEVEKSYPNLHFYKINGIVQIRGSFLLQHEGKELDRYLIEILIPSDYPRSIPVVREIGDRIPKIPDRHMNEKGDACLFLAEERWEAWPIGSSFTDFLQGPVHNFFLGQSLVERGEQWPFGSWGHGAVGIKEYYSRLLGTEDSQIILSYLSILSKKEIKGHWYCPCGSGKRLRNCHLSFLVDLSKKIPPEVVCRSLLYLRPVRNPQLLMP